MKSIIRELINLLNNDRVISSDAMTWGAPIPSFGAPSIAHIATLGLNPSDKEFLDNSGKEINGELRRFHTLKSLGIVNWEQLTDHHIELIESSCTDYFLRNPYNNWFRSLDSIISGTSASYYNKLFHAVHLDLVPFATNSKWANLKNSQKNTLLELSGNSLGKIITGTPIKIIILNGSTVVENFEKISKTKLVPEYIPDWDLTRAGAPSVKGISYSGVVTNISNIGLDHPILALGFNHNIQSSFGVTLKVRNSIRDWITAQSMRGL
ncbi:hypothetical protein TUM18999_51720 [Pseudomonas tohonis]|uniref:Uncharacterized protein n=1 Tax=Pseudomonas tohonis TaxID=2725477 RepID=A0A6J4EEZ1_9PSED|nr:hypothetical protein [Pseudomonas tohonis]BCG26981.1 hypothetical protein TUM18999_51720 [Pseudomonas tohonis]GJN50283.1 hypothetical protein TUM20286_00350 [Pseudomonas tohonis]